MRRLWIQLSLAFSMIAILSAVMLFILIVLYAEIQRSTSQDERGSPQQENTLNIQDMLVVLLQAHFDADGTLEDAVDLLNRIDDRTSSRNASLNVQLRSPDGEVVYGDLPPDTMHEQTHLNGATLEFMVPPPRRPAPPPRGISPEHILVFLSVIGVMMGVMLSVVLGKRLAAPLSQLAQTARQMGQRDFSLRVQPAGSEEMQDVAYAFNEMASQLEISQQLRNDLVADVAHELRTPLTVMESNLRALIDDIHPLTKVEVFSLYDQTRHLTRLVNDLHELSLADANELSFQKEPIAILDLLSPTVDIFRPIAESEGIHFVVHMPVEVIYLRVDAGRLRQVVQNLLVNALRHTPEGGEITLSVDYKDDKVFVQVKDTGEGIPSDHLKYIFERFYRVDQSRNRMKGGAGLGLAIGKVIIKAHGGEIKVTSDISQPSGTCFSFHLPVIDKSN